MAKWEYLRIKVQYQDRFNLSPVKVICNRAVVYDSNKKEEQKDFWLFEYLNELGIQGWELVSNSISGHTAPPTEFIYFKRSLPE